ncbi:serine/threonine protein kinase [Streptacidiphilus sp. PB12-B1b]|nr:serine/threonine protein kinase [Streptacidiphilus sp. PB12-B1b]
MDAVTVLGGRYRLERQLGHGGMGEVWAARDGDLHRDVAIKILLASLGRDPELIHRLKKEARTVAALSHPGITVVHDIGEHDGHPYFVMELLDGATFESLLDACPQGLPVERVATLMVPVLEALGYAHGRDVVHRDVKPANLMVLTTGRVKVLDFGIASYAEATARFTTKGIMGTPPYMPPEQWHGHPAGPGADLYSFGATLFTLLTGRPPFLGPSAPAWMHQHLTAAPPRITGIPDALNALIQRLLAKEPADRPTAVEARQTLLDILQPKLPEIGPGVGLPVGTLRPKALLGAYGEAGPVWTDAGDFQVAGDDPKSFRNKHSTMRWIRMERGCLIGGWTGGILAAVVLLLQDLSADTSYTKNYVITMMGHFVVSVMLVVFGTAAIGAIIGAMGWRRVKSEIVTVGSQGISIERPATPSASFSLGWDELQSIGVKGPTDKAELVVRFQPGRVPEDAKLSQFGIWPTPEADGRYIIYSPHKPDSVTGVGVEAYRMALKNYAEDLSNG